MVVFFPFFFDLLMILEFGYVCFIHSWRKVTDRNAWQNEGRVLGQKSVETKSVLLLLLLVA